jgi:hypothetical protein
MGRGSRVWWEYLRIYLLLGIAVLLIAGQVLECIESGKWIWWRFGASLLLIVLAIAHFADLQRERKRAAPGTSSTDTDQTT